MGRLNKAWAIVQTIVEPEQLKKALDTREAPTLEVTAKPCVRAGYYEQLNVLKIGMHSSVPSIVHEFGHYLEHVLPTEVLAGTKLMLDARAGGDRRLARIPRFGQLEEMYAAGETKVFGDYGKRYYPASTEVLSMGLQYLARPRDARKLIQKDPRLAFMLWRILRPSEHARMMRALS